MKDCQNQPKLEVRLFATLREGRGKVVYADWQEGLTGLELLQILDISPKDASIFLINGKHAEHGAVIGEKDIISLFPPVGGG